MSKHHLQNLAEQIVNKGHGSAPFHYGKSGGIQKKAVIDNWLEAERILSNDEQSASSFMNEGNPNTQK